MSDSISSPPRRSGSHRLVVGVLVGLSWMVAIEYFFAYASALTARQEEPARLLITAASSLAIGMLLLGGEYLLSRRRRGQAAAPAPKTTSPDWFPAGSETAAARGRAQAGRCAGAARTAIP